MNRINTASNNVTLAITKPTEKNSWAPHSSSTIRLELWKGALLLATEKPLFGYGIGSVQDNLNQCYKTQLRTNKDQRFFYPLKESHNSHNQYINMYLSGGIIALLLFLLMLYYNFRQAYINKDDLYLIFILLIGFTLIFENFFSRINGVLFFSLLNSLFLLNKIQQNKNNA